jgi:hypothetical protein
VTRRFRSVSESAGPILNGRWEFTSPTDRGTFLGSPGQPHRAPSSWTLAQMEQWVEQGVCIEETVNPALHVPEGL